MATAPPGKKPVTPPKPLGRLSNQDEAGNKEGDRLSSKSIEENMSKSKFHSNDGANNQAKRTVTYPGPKPALLPKPLKKCIKSRPHVSQRPDMLGSPHESTGNTKQLDISAQETRKKPLSLFLSKAPVAKLEEFDSLYETADAQISPMRPPRSPKMKVFPEGPFKVVDEKPELPVKKRLLHSFPATGKDKDWEIVKKRSSSLGRSGNDASLSTNNKSKSLGRNVFLSEELALSDSGISDANNKKLCPVPPPRRRKKSEESVVSPELNIVNAPIYAHVNYEMKKNRRELNLRLQHAEEKCEEEETVSFAVLEGRLLLTGSKLETNNSIRLMDTCCSEDTPLNYEDNRNSITNWVETMQTATEQEENHLVSNKNLIIENVKINERYLEGNVSLVDENVDVFTNRPSTENSSAFADGLCDMKVNLISIRPDDSQLHGIIQEFAKTTIQTMDTSSNNNENVISNSGESIEGICPNESQSYSNALINDGKDTETVTRDGKSVILKINEHAEEFGPNESYLYSGLIQHDTSKEIQALEPSCVDVVSPSIESIKKLLPLESYVNQNNEAIQRRESYLHRTISINNAEKTMEMVQLCDSDTVSPYIKGETFSELYSTTSTSDNIVQNEIDLCYTKESVINRDAAHQIIDKKTEIVPYQNVNMDINVSTPLDKSRPISTSEVSGTSDLVITEGITETKSENAIYLDKGMISKNILESTPPATRSGAKLWRRQSWSSSKDTTPSPSSVRKQTHISGQWCDEGELSNGALADSDSSDNTKKSTQSRDSSFPVRNKIASWFDSFGKGGSKRKERRSRTTSQFYGEDKQVGSNTVSLIHPPQLDVSLPTSEDQVDGVERPSSGVSGILDSPVFDGETFRDSESENDEQIKVPSSRLSEAQQKERKVFLIAQELMTSERQFVDVLKLLNIDFFQTVKSAGTEQNPVIPTLELLKILNSLPQLQRLNEVLLRDLESRIMNWSSYPKIADVIVKKGPFLKLYSSYIQNFETQCNYLDECCQKYPRFGKVVKEFEALPICKKLEVKHYMLKPVQRIPQYRLLLEDYQRRLEVDSVDFNDTEEALKIVRDVADHANRTIKLGDHLSKLIELQSQLDNYEIIKPGRVYLKDGELFKLSRKVRHPRYFILLNDCLLYTSRLSPSMLRVNKELPLNGMKVFIPQIDDNLNEFNIISITRSFTLSASSEVERREWVSALESAIKDHTSRALTFQAPSLAPLTPDPSLSEPLKLGRQAPVWIQDTRVTMCQSCTTPFTVMFRRHHCRACGKVVCGKCSDNRAPLRYMDFQAERVCEGCHDTLLNEFEGPECQFIINDIMNAGGFKDSKDAYETTKALFKKLGSGNKKKHLLLKKDIPQRLKEVAANDSGSQMSGWLQRRGRRSWKRLWFVLKEQVLYVYKASEDIVALESIPILGYKVEPMTERHFEMYEGIDAKLVFQLAHVGQLPLVFHADKEHLANRWMKTMEEATILH